MINLRTRGKCDADRAMKLVTDSVKSSRQVQTGVLVATP